MNIGIDLSPFRSYQGTEAFAEHMAAELIAAGSGHRFFLFANKGVFPALERAAAESPNASVILSGPRKMESPLRIAFYQQCVLPFRMRARSIGAVFSPSPFFPILAPGRKFVTIHDCAYRRFREFRTPLSELYIRMSFFAARMIAAKIITVSEFSKKELIALHHIPANMIRVIREGEMPEKGKKLTGPASIKLAPVKK